MKQRQSAGVSARRRRFLRRLAVSIAVTVILLWAATALFFRMMSRPQFWQSQIAAYEQADRASPPKPGVIVFTGSSSIRKWTTLADDMKPLNVINRGFGGSRLSDVSYYARQIVTPYHPRAVVLYAGDNDLDFPWRRSPETVLKELEQFVSIVQGDLPETWIYYISMKPAPHGNWPLMDQANRMIAAYIRTQERVQFIDVSAAMLDSHRKLRGELYDSDPRHMNASGYVLWTSIVKPVLMERFGTQSIDTGYHDSHGGVAGQTRRASGAPSR